MKTFKNSLAIYYLVFFGLLLPVEVSSQNLIQNLVRFNKLPRSKLTGY